MRFRNLTLDPVTVEPGTPLQAVAEAFEKAGGHQLPVVRGSKVLGVVTREDLDDQGVLESGQWVGWGTATTAEDLLHEVPLVGPQGLDEGLEALLEHPCAVVVDDEGGLLGLMTEHDAVRVAIDQMPPDQSALSVASAPVRTIDASAPASRAAEVMKWHHARHLVIVDASGVISQRDLVAEGVDEGRELTVGEVWRERPFVTVPDDALLIEVAQQMLDERIGSVPLVDASGTPVAILTRRDLVRFALGGRRERRAMP
jgi:CBS domain-containing protein